MNKSYVKNLGQVAAIVYSAKPPQNTSILWFNLNDQMIYYFDPNLKKWTSFIYAIMGAMNIGSGAGRILQNVDAQDQSTGDILKLRSIEGESGIEVRLSESGDTIIIGFPVFLEAVPTELTFDATINSVQTVNILSNIKWQITGLESIAWLTLPSGNYMGSGDDTRVFQTTQANTSTNARSTFIYLEAVAGGITAVAIKVTQRGTASYVPTYIPRASTGYCQQS